VVVLVGFQKRPSAIFPGTKLGGILPLRKRRKGISFLLGGLVGSKMLQKAGKAETKMSRDFSMDPEGTGR
jgi:hypothetical protein